MGTHNKKLITSVTLLKKNDDELHIFYCVDCRHPIMQYKGETVNMYMGEKPTSLPVVIQCNNKRCSRKYQFEYFAEQDLKNE